MDNGRSSCIRSPIRLPFSTCAEANRSPCGGQFTNGKRPGAVGAYEIWRTLPLRLPDLTLIRMATPNPLNLIDKNGGRYWTRTSDPCDVNTVLYQLS
jgi:hypothetical protein